MTFQVLRITYEPADNFSKFKSRLKELIEMNGGVKELRVRSWTKFLRIEILTILEYVDKTIPQKIEEVTEPELIHFTANDMWQFKVIFKSPVGAENNIEALSSIIKDNNIKENNGMLF